MDQDPKTATPHKYKEAVLCVVFDKVRPRVCLLQKKSGPAQLIDKWNFPGGKVEPGETLFAAASREFKEETGVFIAPTEWKALVGFVWAEGKEQEFRIFAVTAKTDLDECHTVEEEPVASFSLRSLPTPRSPQFDWVLALARDSDILAGDVKLLPPLV